MTEMSDLPTDKRTHFRKLWTQGIYTLVAGRLVVLGGTEADIELDRDCKQDVCSDSSHGLFI